MPVAKGGDLIELPWLGERVLTFELHIFSFNKKIVAFEGRRDRAKRKWQEKMVGTKKKGRVTGEPRKKGGDRGNWQGTGEPRKKRGVTGETDRGPGGKLTLTLITGLKYSWFMWKKLNSISSVKENKTLQFIILFLINILSQNLVNIDCYKICHHFLYNKSLHFIFLVGQRMSYLKKTFCVLMSP